MYPWYSWVDGWEAWTSFLLPERPTARDEVPEGVEEDVHALFDLLHGEISNPELADSARHAFRILEEIGRVIDWDRLRRALVALVSRSVDLAELSFGAKNNDLKRKFVIDLVMRAVARTHFSGVPFVVPIANPFAPVVGVFVDWTVQLYNLHRGHTWYPTVAKAPRLPWIFGPDKPLVRFGWRLLLGLWRLYAFVAKLFRAPSLYERRLAKALAATGEEEKALCEALPPSSVGMVIDRLFELFEKLGQVTAPHIATIDHLLRIARRLDVRDPERRHQIVVAAARETLIDIYRHDPWAVHLLESPMGTFVISQAVSYTESMLSHAGLWPAQPD